MKFKKFRLKELSVKIGSGATPRGGKESYLDSAEYALIRSQNVLDFVFSKNGLAYIDENQAKDLDNVEVKDRDILLNITGDSVARVCQVITDILPARVNQHVAIIRPDINQLCPEFLKYYMLNPDFKNYMLGLASIGATRNALTKGMIENFEIEIPTLNEQKYIAKILLDFDAKIELNIKMNRTLEQISQAIFKHWFIDFEFPNENGKHYRSSGGKMVDSEMGKIPEGWKAGMLGDIIENFDSRRVPLSSQERELKKGIYPYYGATSIMDYVDEYLFDGTYLLMGEDGSVMNDQGFPFLQYVWGKFWVNNHAHVLIGKNGISTEFLYLFLKKTNIAHIVTGAVQPKINQGNMNSIEVIIPGSRILSIFDNTTRSIYELYKNNFMQNQNLSRLRDSLLPRLMSGKIRIA